MIERAVAGTYSWVLGMPRVEPCRFGEGMVTTTNTANCRSDSCSMDSTILVTLASQNGVTVLDSEANEWRGGIHQAGGVHYSQVGRRMEMKQLEVIPLTEDESPKTLVSGGGQP